MNDLKDDRVDLATLNMLCSSIALCHSYKNMLCILKIKNKVSIKLIIFTLMYNRIECKSIKYFKQFWFRFQKTLNY